LINSLWLAGLVLGNDCYPAGSPRMQEMLTLAYQWIIRSLLALDKDKDYRGASKLADALKETWTHNGMVDAWDIVGRIFDSSWRMTRNDFDTSDTLDMEATDIMTWSDQTLQAYS
jgi:hypothetical protein